MSIRLLTILLPLVVLTSTSVGHALPRPGREVAPGAAFQAWDIPELRRLLLDRRPGNEEVLWWGVLKILEWDLPAAEHFLSRSRVALARELLPVVRGSRRVQSRMTDSLSPQGRIRVFHAPGPLEALLPYLFEAGDAAFEQVSRWLGGSEEAPEGPIPVWVVSSFEELSLATGLERRQLDAAGAVAICDLRRIVMVSPGALPFGYPYADTLAHEMVHFLLTTRGDGRTPVWFQEGVAKAWERTWRGRPVGEVGRTLNRVLTNAMLQGRLIPLERIEKGLLHLAGAEEVQIAFGELAAFMTWMQQKQGQEVIGRLVAEMRIGDPDIAFLRVVGERPGEWFRTFLAEQLTPSPETPRPPEARVLIREEVQDSLGGGTPGLAARLELADRLVANGRLSAAAMLLREERDRTADPHPEVIGRLARVLRQAGRPEEALAVLDRAGLDEEEFPVLSRERGLSLGAAGRWSEAMEPLRILLWNDPWDGEVHQALATAFRSVGRRDLAEREERVMEIGRW